MVDPYRTIMTLEPKDPNPEITSIETTFLPEHARPAAEHLQAIGRVATAYSVLERVLGMVLARLVLAPDFPTMAITKDLSMDNHLKALRTLIQLHEERYHSKIASKDLTHILANMATDVAKLKDERNIIVHTCWYRMGDKLIGLSGRPATISKVEAYPAPEKTTAEINDLARRIETLGDAMFIVVQYLPEVDEVRHAQFQSRVKRPLLPETQSKPQDPPEPSRA